MAHHNEHDRASFKAPPKHRTSNDQQEHLSPARSRTDPPAAVTRHHEKSSLHRRLHSNTLRNRAFTGGREHGYRQAAKDTVQSALELKPPISFDSLLRRDKKTSSDIPNRKEHRRTRQAGQQQRDVNEWTAQQARLAEQLRVRPEQIEKAKRENARREEALQKSLKEIEDIAMSSTRQLDDTYYAILERASSLRNTVSSLQQLAEQSRAMHTNFQEETAQLEQDTKKSLEHFGNFEAQEEAISSLVDQIRASKDKTKQLDDRLEAARNRVEAFEEREKQKRKTNRQRWGITWVVLAAVLILVLGVIVARHRSAVGSYPYKISKVFNNLEQGLIEIASPVAAMLVPSVRAGEDTVLGRMFDEL